MIARCAVLGRSGGEKEVGEKGNPAQKRGRGDPSWEKTQPAAGIRLLVATKNEP